MFNFVDTVPPPAGRGYVHKGNCEKLLDALLANPNKWAQVPITRFYPDLEGGEEKKLKAAARTITNRLANRHDLKPFNEYNCEAKSRGADVYVRICLNRRQLKEMGLE